MDANFMLRLTRAVRVLCPSVDTRKSQRTSHSGRVDIYWVDTHDGYTNWLRGEFLDRSDEGACVKVLEPLRLGLDLRMVADVERRGVVRSCRQSGDVFITGIELQPQ